MKTNIEELPEIIGRARETNIYEFVKLIGKARTLLAEEHDVVEKLRVTGRLVNVPSDCEAIVVGDIHGDLESLAKILKNCDFLNRVQKNENLILIFLGDYGDRGIYSTEVYYVVLRLKEMFPRKVVLMRGNHEGPEDLLAYPHDLPTQLHERFGEEWRSAYRELREFFNYLYNAVLMEDKCIMLHGGVPSQAQSLDDVAYAHLKHPSESHLEEILWSDPQEGLNGVYPSPRGAGKLFGEDITENFLKMVSVKVLIRGHEPADEGFKINHNGKILTLFSRMGTPYFNNHAAYLQLDLREKLETAYELKQFVTLL